MKKLLLILALGLSGMVSAQDFSLVNHNLTPFSLNPSLVGNAKDIRFGLSYRQQWMVLGNHYHTIRFSFDESFHQKKCAVGFVYSYDNMANGVYDVNEFSLLYGHAIKLRDEWSLRLGLQGTLYLNKFGYDKIKYGDQYDSNTRRPSFETLEEFDTDVRNFFDVSVGASFIIESKLTLGAALYHIAEPSNGFMELKDNTLNRKFVAHINYLQDLQYKNGLWGRESLSGNYFFMNGSYQKQDDFQMLNAGLGVAWEPLVVGVCDKNSLSGINVVGLMVGAHYKSLQAFYVYDLFTSSKKNGSWSHELTLIYIIKKTEKYPCPVTYW